MMKRQKSFYSRVKGIFTRLISEPVYDTASGARRLRAWVVPSSGPNAAGNESLTTIRNRSRDLTRKFPLLNGAYDTITANIVGIGLKALSKAESKADKDLIKAVWDEWCGECDADGVNSYASILELAVRGRYESGEVFIRHRPLKPGTKRVPYQIQILEAEFVPETMNEQTKEGNTIIAGIEFDASGQRVAYHMYNRHPYEKSVSGEVPKTVRVPAEQVMHYYKQLRPGQIRGLPEGFSAHFKARELLIYDEAELAKKQTAALMAGFITSPEGNSVINEDSLDGEAAPGEAIGKLEPASLYYLEPGEDVKFSNPVDSGASYEPFLKATLRSLAASLNMTYEEFSLDLSGVNFSSIRAGLNQSQRKYHKEQARLVHMVCMPIWNAFFDAALLAGIFNFPGYAASPEKYRAVRFQTPGWSYVNPLQEIQAQKEQVKAGFKSREQVVAESGGDVEEVDEAIARDKERAKTLGLAYDIDVSEADKGSYYGK
jgi:lambda family phage portal protein